MSVTEAKSFCRICQGFCGVKVSVHDNRIVKVVGDKDDPVSRGYICFKGAQAADQHHGPKRLLRSLQRVDGALEPAASEPLVRAAGGQLRALAERYGPESIAIFQGTQAIFNSLTMPAIGAFAQGLGTPRLFTTMTIDQSAKWIAEARMGGWAAGPQTFADADVWMLFGSNPLVSMVTAGGANQFVIPDPVKTLKRKRDEGLQLIVIDPRRTETARFATLHLQPKPGYDAAIAAAMLNVILSTDLHDSVFCNEYVDGFDELRRAVASFVAYRIERLAGLAAGDIVRAAEMFAAGHRGMAGTGTGPDMARHSNVAEHLVQALNVVCGRFPRAGDPIANGGVLRPAQSAKAEVVPASRSWEAGPKTLTHELGTIKGTMMSAEIADDILSDSEQRIRALICVGGNLAVALPDQVRAEAALRCLELLIVIDPYLTATSRLAHYVFAPRLQYERPDHTGTLEGMFQVPFAHRTPAILAPPESVDLIDDWLVLDGLAREVGFSLNLPIPEDRDSETLMSNLLGAAAVDQGVVSACRGAYVDEPEPRFVGPRNTHARFELLAADVAEELRDVSDALASWEETGNYLLVVRRHREVMNSTGTQFAALERRFRGSPLYINPTDMAALGVDPGDQLAVVRGNVTLNATVRPDEEMRRGVVAMSHGWSGDPAAPWQATNALVDADNNTQSINRMPVMTGIEVELRRA